MARHLIVSTGKVLLDREMDHPVVEEIRQAIETGPEEGDTRITDLHVRRVGKRAYSCAVSLVTQNLTLTPSQVRQRLAVHSEIAHATNEIQVCATGDRSADSAGHGPC